MKNDNFDAVIAGAVRDGLTAIAGSVQNAPMCFLTKPMIFEPTFMSTLKANGTAALS